MFGLFKKKPSGMSPELRALADRMIGPQALAVAIAETVGEYVRGVQAGRIQYPAHRRKSEGVKQLWNDVRLEALHKAFNFRQSDLMMLADIRQQPALLNSFVNDRPHFRMPQPSGEPIADTLQGVWQVYLYLSSVGSEVADAATDQATLKAKGVDILSDFTAGATALQAEWAAYRQAGETGAVRSELPRTLLDVLWDDVTAKAKSIALSKRFGPNPEAGIQFLLNMLAKEGKPGDVERMKADIAKVRAAKQPDDIDLRS